MDQLCHVRHKFSFFSRRYIIISLHFIDNNPVVIDLSNLVQMPDVAEADFIIERYEEVLDLARDPSPDVGQAPVQVDEHYVVVEDEEVDDQQA